jgi:hypothetical protein
MSGWPRFSGHDAKETNTHVTTLVSLLFALKKIRAVGENFLVFFSEL